MPCPVHSGHTLALLPWGARLEALQFFLLRTSSNFFGGCRRVSRSISIVYSCDDAARLATTCRWNQFTFGVLVPLRTLLPSLQLIKLVFTTVMKMKQKKGAAAAEARCPINS